MFPNRGYVFLSSGSPFVHLLSAFFQLGTLYGATMKWVLKDGADIELQANEETLQSTLAVAKNLKKELSEKAEESSQSEARVQELEDRVKGLEEREKQLLEENRLVVEDRDHKVAELTQFHDEEESWQCKLKESKKALAEERVSIVLFII